MKMNRNVIAIYIASFLSYHMYVSTALLASFYAWYPSIDPNLVILMYSAPMLVSALLSIALGAIMPKLNKKVALLFGLATIIATGCMIVFTHGSSFWVSLAAMILSSVGFAVILNVTNTLLVEIDPASSAKLIAINTGVGCIGSMILTYGAGVLAKDGDWTRAYWLCFPVIISFILVLILFKNPKKQSYDQSAAEGSAVKNEAAPVSKMNLGLFALLIVIFLFGILGNTAWNANFSSYVIDITKSGTTVETGMMNTLASLGGVLGGLVFAGIVYKYLKTAAVAVCILMTAAPRVAVLLGIDSIPVLYVASFLFMLFFQPASAAVTAGAGKLVPGGFGVSAIGAVMGLGGFLGPYILGALTSLMSGSIIDQFVIGCIFTVIGAVIAIPVMRKINSGES